MPNSTRHAENQNTPVNRLPVRNLRQIQERQNPSYPANIVKTSYKQTTGRTPALPLRKRGAHLPRSQPEGGVPGALDSAAID